MLPHRKPLPFRLLLAFGFTISILLPGCLRSPVFLGSSSEPPTSELSFPTFTPGPVSYYHEQVSLTPILNGNLISNPGMGWQESPDPFDAMSQYETVSYSNRRDIAWSALNPARDVYNWYPLEAQLAEAMAAGRQFSFRIYTYVGEGYDGNKIPAWVMAEGARLLSTGEPDYSNCIYQEAWGRFVNELLRVYDGNPNLAFIDISGYGNFNEWSWQDSQTQWDEGWQLDYSVGNTPPASFRSLDGQARRRLADMFIGGSFSGHACRLPDGSIFYLDYSYPGFQKTQLLMPYAGIVQSTQYVNSRRADVGFRFDCLGRDGRHLFEKIGKEIQRTWRRAPIVFELCKPAEVDPADAAWLLQISHASLVHNNHWNYSKEQLLELLFPLGYHFYMSDFNLTIDNRQLDTVMVWQNLGLAPNYPKMGQNLQLVFCLVDGSGQVAFQDVIPADVSSWLPADSYQGELPGYLVTHSTLLPSYIGAGIYQVGVAIINQRTGLPIQLALEGRDANGIYILFNLEIK